MKKLLLLLVAMNLASCSLSGSNKETAQVKSDDLEFAVDTLEETVTAEEFHVEEQKIASTEPNFDEFKSEMAYNDNNDVMMVAQQEELPAIVEVDESIAQVTSHEAPVKAITDHQVNYESHAFLDQMEHYTVQKGDTLMMVAFKIYGDYGKWKELKSWNQGVSKLVAGMRLQYQVPEKSFGWMPSGEAYLIKTGDTLGSISLEKYDTSKKWRMLYQNNKPLIKDPNLIFAGFTIYYHPERQLASEVK